MGYDSNTRLTSWNLIGPSTGVTTTTVNLRYDYGYDGANRTTAITVTDNGISSVEPITHAVANWITGWVGPGSNGLQNWGYNGDGSVISNTSFINNGFHTTVYTYSATQPNELVQQHTDSLGVDNYTYDNQGNVISEVSTDPITSPYYVNMHFGYDALERPISATNVQNGALITVTLGYNAASERITYTAVMSGQVVDSEKFAYNADGSLAQTIATTATLNQNGSIKSSGAYTDTYAYDPGRAPLYLLRQQTASMSPLQPQVVITSAYSYITDGNGDVVGLADSSGHRVNIDTYNPFGTPVATGIQETVPQIFRLFGTLSDPELGLLFTICGWYDIGGHCLQPDTSLGARVYGFENNDTVDYRIGIMPYANAADADGGIVTGAGALCVGTIEIPGVGVLDCFTAILLFGAALVAAYLATHSRAVPIPLPQTQTRTNTKKKQPQNRAAVQIQGNDINMRLSTGPGLPKAVAGTISFSWAQTNPIPASDGLAKLAQLWALLNPEQQKQRRAAYPQAQRFIADAPSLGGVYFPGAGFADTTRSIPSARIDVPVFSGVAFSIP